MISSSSVPRETFYPPIGISSDGADDGDTLRMNQRGMPLYDTTRDANKLPEYTRQYLQNLSTALDARVKSINDDVAYYSETLAKSRKMHKITLGVLLGLGVTWLVSSIILLIAVFRDNALDKKS
ncbi:hypothetical protein GGR51DRAFT_554664 [Nemania sp. FL0031]|nr:hypothetical protein GGR51DRAFT_554664 [Nemania sp. FL0031]